ncbi:MAG: hypothetical protein CFE29_04435 [Bradyrhizobiaceae bacterium PARB1]|jgi:hypothetical protein|nr:MAG: hypothetical protein CFE29_04435 [Bradyrhizobiaceae bacterium PARB1]
MHYTYGQQPDTAVLIEEAIQIAWDYLELTGEIDDGEVCSQILLYDVETMVRQGVRSRLLLSNRAISRYMQFKASRDLKAAS